MATKKDTKAIATVDVSKFSIQNVEMNTTSEEIAEELDGLGTIPFDRVKWPTGGNTIFEVPDEEDDSNLVSVDKIAGVIVYHHPLNSRWENNYNGNNEPPVCSAMDGKKGLNVETGELIDCASCPYNQFDSNGSTSGKACKNIHRLYVIQNDNPVPLVVALPPTSLSSFRNYLGKKLLIRGKRAAEVVTEITLKKENSKNNMSYAKAVFRKVGDLNAEQIQNAKSLSAMIKSIAQTEVVVSSEDYNVPPADESYTADVEFEPVPKESPANAQPESVKAEPLSTPKTDPKQFPPATTGFEFLDPTNPTEDGNPFA
jgi:hypothetical protein